MELSTAQSPDIYPSSWEGFVADIKLCLAAVVQHVPQFYSKHMQPCHLLMFCLGSGLRLVFLGYVRRLTVLVQMTVIYGVHGIRGTAIVRC